MAQLSDSQLATIKDHPIGDALSSFRAAFGSAHPRASLRGGLGHYQQLVAQPARRSLVLRLIGSLQLLPAADILTTADGADTLSSTIALLYFRLSSNQTDVKNAAQLVKYVIDEKDDPTIWATVYDLIRQTQPAPPAAASTTSLSTAHLRTPSKSITQATRATQTPNTRTTGSIANSFEHRKLFDKLLKAELDRSLFIGVPNFFETFFGEVESLEQTAGTVFRKCNEGNNPLYTTDHGWRDWPDIPTQNNVLGWFTGLVGQLKKLADKHCSVGNIQRETLAKPDQSFEGSVALRRMDLGFANAAACDQPRWSEVLVVGELKSNEAMDKSSDTWHDLARYAREVFTAQCTRRFVLGFTLCGSTMRLWEFDRTGGIASKQFDINEDGLRFVSVIMGFLLMDREQLGFDPTILEADGKWVVEIAHNDQTERLVLSELITRVSCVAGRATTCWKAYREGDKARRPYVVKDSWQYPERDEEGKLLEEATREGVVNVARHHHHETVHVAGTDDDVCNNIRKGLDISAATNYRPSDSMPPPSTCGLVRETRSTSSAGQKRSSSQIDASEPATKRVCSGSQQIVRGKLPKNRVHRRLVLGDYGKPIYKASSRAALLAAMEGCIEGHRSLYEKGKMLQRDVSQNNLMINEQRGNPSWKAFLIDLDFAIKRERIGVSGARDKTGTLAFMAVGVLLGEQHTFMHDLESFFWVLFWICIHYEGPGKRKVAEQFDSWNYMHTEELARMKLGVIANKVFLRTVTDNFTEYYQPLIPWIDKLRKVIFPNGVVWEQEEAELYSYMIDILREARDDTNVLQDHELSSSPEW